MILVAGIGNIFLGDDAFGVEVVQRLAQRSLPHEVHVMDFGTRGIDLMYTLLDGCGSVILVDAVSRGEPPGTLYIIEPEVADAATMEPEEPLIDMHTMDPAKVLRVARSLGSNVERVLLVGCEPRPVDHQQETLQGLSEPVAQAVHEAVEMIESLVARLLAPRAAVGDFGAGCGGHHEAMGE